MKHGYIIETTMGVTYWTDADGYVISRSDNQHTGYSKQWQIIGASARHNARHIIPLADIANGAEFGQGWVHDIDHGAHRTWMGHPGRIKSVGRYRLVTR